jgi:hypothetical protein
MIDPIESFSKEESPVLRIKRQLEQIRGYFWLLLSPGDKQFKDMPKRVRLMFVSFTVPLIFLTLKVVFPIIFSDHLWAVLASIVLGLVTYAGVFWGVKGQVRKESLYSVMAMPLWFVTTYSMFLFTIFSGDINRVYLWALFSVAIAAFMVGLYIISLTANILNVTLFYTIPLSKLGESIAYLLGIAILFFITYVSDVIALQYFQNLNYVELGISSLITFLSIFGVTGYLWGYFVVRRRGHFWFTALFSLLIFVFLAVLAVVIDVPWKLASVVSAIAYVLYGQVIHKEQNTLSATIITEFSLIIVAIIVLFVAF